MRKKLVLGILSLLAPSAFLFAATYEELVALALASESSLKRLSVEAERARITLGRSELARLTPRLKVGSGAANASLSSDGAQASASPSVSVALPGGPTLGLGVTLASTSLGPYARGEASASVPLIRGTDDKRLASLVAREALARADAKASRGALEAELKLDRALAAALKAEVSLSSALRAEAKARRELKRAVEVDGAEPGGASYASLARDVRTAVRSRRDAETSRSEAFAALRRLVAGASDEALLPESFPATSLLELPPSKEKSCELAAAKAASRLGELQAAEKGRRLGLDAKLGASYCRGSDSAIVSENSLGAGAGVSTGLAASLDKLGLGVDLSVGWGEASGPTASLALTWAPPPAGDEALRSRDETLAARLRELDVEDALAEAAADLAGLADERQGLEEAAADAAEDLEFAEKELAAYEGRRAAGFVGDSDYDEARAVRDECAARVRAAALDRITWNVRARLLSAGAGAFEELQ